MSKVAPDDDLDIDYPAHPEERLSESTQHLDLILLILQGLRLQFRDQQNEIAVLGDVAWYPVQKKPKLWRAPDVMVIFGRPQIHRTSYVQHLEEGIAPQVVFEMGSRGNRSTEVEKKRKFYQRYGVEEYYWIDHEDLSVSVFQRQEKKLAEVKDIQSWTSPRLGIRMEWADGHLNIFDRNNQPMIPLTDAVLETQQQLEDARYELNQAQQELRQRGEQQERLERLQARLREMGIDPDQV